MNKLRNEDLGTEQDAENWDAMWTNYGRKATVHPLDDSLPFDSEPAPTGFGGGDGGVNIAATDRDADLDALVILCRARQRCNDHWTSKKVGKLVRAATYLMERNGIQNLLSCADFQSRWKSTTAPTGAPAPAVTPPPGSAAD